MTDDMNTRRPYSKSKKPFQWVGYVMIAIGLTAIGVSFLMVHNSNGIAERALKSDAAVKQLYFEFCIKRANKYPTADVDAKKVCDAIWEGTLAANKDGGVAVSPFRIVKLVEVESGFNQRAISSALAVGLAQIHIPAHGQEPFGCNVVYDAVCNVYTGVRLYQQALIAFDGDETKALYAYNRGIGAVKRALASGEYPGRGDYAAKVMRI